MPTGVYEYFYIMGNVVTEICDRCLSHCLFPEELSMAKVRYLFKSGNRKLVEKYRPISILLRFSKIIERVVCLKLMNYLETYSMLLAAQYGFRKNLSTESSCQVAVQYFHSNFEIENYVAGNMFALAKTIDYMDGSLLLEKVRASWKEKFFIEMVHKLFFCAETTGSVRKCQLSGVVF